MVRLLIFSLAAIIFCSCQSITGSGNIITETRKLNKFEGVKSSGSIDVEVINHENQSVKVEADDNILPLLITEVEDGVLNIYFKNNLSFRKINAKVYVSAPLLHRIIVSGSGSIVSKDTLKDVEQIELTVSGSGDISAFVDAPTIITNNSGSGTIDLQGRTKVYDCSISGSGDINCKKLLSENTMVNIRGSGTAHVYASVKLIAKISGSGDIYFSGNPTHPEIHKAGSGSVQAEK